MSIQTETTHSSGTAKYILGFVLSAALTLISFGAVMKGWMIDWSVGTMVIFLLGLAAIQMAVQIVFFLHLDEGPDAKWNIISMWVAVFCVVIIIAGTWLTMQHLNYNMIGGSGRVIRDDVVVQPSTSQIPSVDSGTNVDESGLSTDPVSREIEADAESSSPVLSD